VNFIFRQEYLEGQVKENEIGRAYNTDGEKMSVYRVLMEDLEGKRSTDRP
jgi:hypothetical protein